MEPKKSVVTAIAENVKQWAGQNGTVYYHTVTFVNGDSGSYGSKTPKCEKFTIGVEADYTKEIKVVGEYSNVIIKPAVIAQNSFSGGKKEFNQKAVIAQNSITNAVNFLQGGSAYDTANVITAAEVFYKWV